MAASNVLEQEEVAQLKDGISITYDREAWTQSQLSRARWGHFAFPIFIGLGSFLLLVLSLVSWRHRDVFFTFAIAFGLGGIGLMVQFCDLYPYGNVDESNYGYQGMLGWSGDSLCIVKSILRFA